MWPVFRQVSSTFFDFDIQRLLPSIVISAHSRLLDVLLTFKTPDQLLNLCQCDFIARRLLLMLQLSPLVLSEIDRNSSQFRNLVLLHFPCRQHRIADLKLLYYYFSNRIYSRYGGRLLEDDRVFAILPRDETILGMAHLKLC